MLAQPSFKFFTLLFISLFLAPPTQGSQLNSAKIGNHETYTRVVFRFSQPLLHYQVVQRHGKEIIIELTAPQLSLKSPSLGPPIQIGRVIGYKLAPKGGRKLITIKLSKPSSLRRVFDLPATSHDVYRLVIDIHHPLKPSSRALSPNTPKGALRNSAPTSLTSSSKETLVISDTLKPTDTIETLASRLTSSEELGSHSPALDPQISEGLLDLRPSLRLPASWEKLPLPQVASLSEKPIIVIDPGHGGKDLGTSTPDKYYEKDITLQFAHALQRALNESGRYLAILTRNRDVFVPLRERFARAQEVGAHLLLSLHVDASANRNIRGLSVYVLSNQAMDTESTLLARPENSNACLSAIEKYQDDSLPPQDIIKISQTLAQRQAILLQDFLAETIPREYHHVSQLKRSADLAILKAPNIPSVLIELGYASHPEDQKKLRDNDYQNTVITSMLKAINLFFEAKGAS